MAARLWNKAPFVRLLAAMAVGVVAQRYLQLPVYGLLICFVAAAVLLSVYSLFSIHWRYKLSAINGLSLMLLVTSFGSIAVWCANVQNNPLWFGRVYHNNDFVVATLQEPLVEKTASYKALASVQAVYEGTNARRAEGKIILYFKKDSVLPSLQYGSRILFKQALQPIKNAGNPGSFNYEAYSFFQGITHQVYLTRDGYVVLPATSTNPFQHFIYATRAWVVATLKKFIHGDKEQGLAEALLIGYKDDLDKNLVQAYSNTGVVHIIAISGLHLGLIYGLLVLLTKPLKRVKRLHWLRLLFIIASLWLFSILAGGGPSVLRSALMFSLIALGEVALRKSNIFNALAFSAFILLCINPFWLWDVGFQLSYAAVVSIILFFQPIYNWFHFTNKAVDFVWKLTAVTLSAQILTLSISIYHFHQMPLLFLLTNFIAVPLSSGILLGEILLCAIFILAPVAKVVGFVLWWMIYFMNSYIEGLDRLPFSTWNFLSINLAQAFLLFFFSVAICYWFMDKQRRYAWVAFGSLGLFMLFRGVSFYTAYRQREMVVYNVPKHPAIDIINGRYYAFLGDSALLQDGFERNFHLQPSRILHRITADKNDISLKHFSLGGKQVLLLDEALPFSSASPRQTIDVLVLSRNPKIYIPKLLNTFALRQVVIDGSVPLRKAALWKRDCDSLHIPCYDVSEKGAFVMNW